MNCGREPGGACVVEHGICPVATEIRLDGAHGGKNGGRICWVVSGTFCGNKVQGKFAAKIASCKDCPFYRQVRKEERATFILNSSARNRLH